MKKLKKILLMTPPYHSGVLECAGRWMPLCFVTVSAALKKKGYDVILYDAMTEMHDLEDITGRLKMIQPDVVAITAFTASAPAALSVLKLSKTILPDAITVFGGIHANFCYREILSESSDVDFVVIGEGERTFPELLDTLKKNNDPGDVHGLAYREAGRVVCTHPREFVQDLDSLDHDWEIIDWSKYSFFVFPGSTMACIGTSRGCNQACTFCSQQKFWKRTWRSLSPENVVRQLSVLKYRYGVDVTLIVDELPTHDPARWEEILDRIIQKRLDMMLFMETRVEDVVRDRKILKKYRKAGIVHIYVGVEAGDQDTLDTFNKNLRTEESLEALRLLNDSNIISETSFVLGMPDETPETIQRTLALANYYNPDFAHFLTITPWPYSDIYKDLKPYIEEWDYSKYNLVEPIVRPKQMSREELFRELLMCYCKFYSEKAKTFSSIPDSFKRNYMLSSMKLMMNNSFLTKHMKKNGWMHPPSDKKNLETVLA